MRRLRTQIVAPALTKKLTKEQFDERILRILDLSGNDRLFDDFKKGKNCVAACQAVNGFVARINDYNGEHWQEAVEILVELGAMQLV